MNDPTTYFAAAPTEDIGERLSGKIEDGQKATLTSAVMARIRNAYLHAYGLDPGGVHSTSQILRGGEAGEIAKIRVNHARALVNTLLNLITGPKVVWEPSAVNIDYDSLRECDLARAILEYFWSHAHVSRLAMAALESALFFGEGFVLLDWDDNAGEVHAVLLGEPLPPDAPPETPPNEDEVQRTGSVVFKQVFPWDVIRDPTKTSWEACSWVIVTVPTNKFDLAAQYPEQAKAIVSMSAGERLGVPQSTSQTAQLSDDDVLLHRFYHRKTPALPNGREVLLLADKTVLSDMDLRFDDIPLYRVSAGEQAGSSYGYSSWWDVLGIQDLIDSLQSTVASNQSTFAGQVIATEEGSEVQPQDVGGGMRMIYHPVGTKPPTALVLCKTPAEVFTHLGNLRKDQELIAGLNSVVRGEPPGGGLSGSALALLQSQALQQSSAVQSNYLRLVEGIGTGLVCAIKKFASAPMKLALVGKANASLVEETEYTKDSISRISRVTVNIGNPLAQTSSGRIEMAQELIKMGLVKTAEQYEQVLSTGKLEPLTQSLHHEMLLIRSENEQLSRGEDPVVSVLDQHILHCREHKTLVSSPEVRSDPVLLQAVLKHIDEHTQVYYSAPPQALLMTGQPLPPQVPMPMGPGGPPPPGDPPPPMGAQDEGGPGPDGGAPPKKPAGMANGPAKPINLPSQPKDPSTGRRWDPNAPPKGV